MNVRPLRRLTLAASALLLAGLPGLAVAGAAAPATSPADTPCTLLTPDEIKAVIGAPVLPGMPSVNDEAKECTWKDAGGHDRVYLNLKEVKDWKSFRDSMQATGKMTPVTGVAEDAFFVASSGNSAAFYTLKKGHVVLLTVDGTGFTKAENEASEKALAPHILEKL